jgi:hypothetical protein
MFQQVLVKRPNTIFCENPLSGSGVVTGRQTWRSLQAPDCNFTLWMCKQSDRRIYKITQAEDAKINAYFITIIRLNIYPTTKLPCIPFHTSHVELLANVRLLSRSKCSIGCYCHAFNIDPHNADHKKNTSSCVRSEYDRHTKRELPTCLLKNTHMWFRIMLFHRMLQPYASCLVGSDVQSRPRDLLSWLRLFVVFLSPLREPG